MPKRPTIRARLEAGNDELLDVLRGSDAPPKAGKSPAWARRVQRKNAAPSKAGKPTKRQAGKSASQDASNSTSTRTKATFYLDDADLAVLEEERRTRLDAGERRSDVDLSSLVREAIRRRYGKGKKGGRRK